MAATSNDLGIKLFVCNDSSIPLSESPFTGKYVNNWFLTPSFFFGDPGLSWYFCLDGIDGSGCQQAGPL